MKSHQNSEEIGRQRGDVHIGFISDKVRVAPILIDPFEVTGGELDIAMVWEMNEKSEMNEKRE